MTKYWYFGNQYGRLAAILNFCKSTKWYIFASTEAIVFKFYNVVPVYTKLCMIKYWYFGNQNDRLAAILYFSQIYEVIYLCKYLSDCFQILQSYVWPSIDALQINIADWRPSWIFANRRSRISLQVLKRLFSTFTMLFLSIQSYVWSSIDTWNSKWPTGGHLEFLQIYEVIYLCKYWSDCFQIWQCCSCLYKVMYDQVLIL